MDFADFLYTLLVNSADMGVNLSSQLNTFSLWRCLVLYIFKIFRSLTTVIVVVAKTTLKNNYMNSFYSSN